jgi:carbon monoxide dehydrogenase subunit G
VESTESITIDRPAGEVWPLVGDVRAWPKWIKGISDVEIGSEALATGSELEYKFRGRPAHATVDQYEEGRSIGIGAEEKSWNFAETITLTPQGDQTEVTFAMRFEPTAAWASVTSTLLSPFKGPLLANPMKKELLELKRVVEEVAH